MQLEYYLSSINRNKIKILILPIIVCLIQLYNLHLESSLYSLDIIFKAESSKLDRMSNTIDLLSSESIISSILQNDIELVDIKVVKESNIQIKITLKSTIKEDLLSSSNKINSFIVEKTIKENNKKIKLCINDINRLIAAFNSIPNDSKQTEPAKPNAEINLHPISCSEIFQNNAKLIYVNASPINDELKKDITKSIIIKLENDITSLNSLIDQPIFSENNIGLPISKRHSKFEYMHIILNFFILLAGTSFIVAHLEKNLYEIK